MQQCLIRPSFARLRRHQICYTGLNLNKLESINQEQLHAHLFVIYLQSALPAPPTQRFPSNCLHTWCKPWKMRGLRSYLRRPRQQLTGLIARDCGRQMTRTMGRRRRILLAALQQKPASPVAVCLSVLMVLRSKRRLQRTLPTRSLTWPWCVGYPYA